MSLQKELNELDDILLKCSKIIENYDNIKLEITEQKLRSYLSKMIYEMESKVLNMASSVNMPQSIFLNKRLNTNWEKPNG